MIMTATDNLKQTVEQMLNWSAPKETPTVRGPRLLRVAQPAEPFWRLWRTNNAELRGLGLSVGKDVTGFEWQVKWWQELPEEVVQERAAAVEASRATDVEADLPCPDGLAYMGFQRAGIVYASGRPGTLIADEMGLGKTIQALGVVNNTPAADRILIITKKTLKMNWWREARKWLLNFRAHEIGIAESDHVPSTRIVIINYETVLKFAKRLSEINWDVIIIDECHMLKNPQAQRTKAILGYKPKRDEPPALASSGIPAKRKLLLTGTPIENNVEEMWALLWYIDRERFKSVWELKKMGGVKYQPGCSKMPMPHPERLQRILRETVMVRRLKADVLKDLPPKVRMLVEFDTSGMEHLIEAEKDLWNENSEEMEQAQADLELAKASDDPEVYRKAITKLRQIQGVKFEEMARIRAETAIAKVPKTIAFLHEQLEETGKVLVFAHHREALEKLHAAFPGESVVVHGQHSLEHRDSAVRAFMTDPRVKLFFGSIRATGEGLTLTSASLVVFHESDWVPSKVTQCEDRAHRIGQKDVVVVKQCVVNGSLDARMLQVCVEKQALADKVLDNKVDEVAPEIRPDIEDKTCLVADWKPLSTKAELEKEAATVSQEKREAVHAALRLLDAMCDGARKIDGSGFAKIDVAIGKSLSGQSWLSPKQVALGARLARKYWRQLPSELIEKIGGKLKA